jgi:hypothetical protein
LAVRVIIDEMVVHELYVSGITEEAIAEKIEVNPNTLHKFITDQRKASPEKWPYRNFSGNQKKATAVTVIAPLVASFPPPVLSMGPANSKSVTRQMTDEERIRYGVPTKGATDWNGEDCKRPIGNNFLNQRSK